MLPDLSALVSTAVDPQLASPVAYLAAAAEGPAFGTRCRETARQADTGCPGCDNRARSSLPACYR